MAKRRNKLVEALQLAAEFERGRPVADMKITNFKVIRQKDRAAVTDLDTGVTSIHPIKRQRP